MSHRLQPLARTMRKNLTKQEAMLWVHLKDLRKEGHKFRKQVPFQSFILDFVCFSAKLVIELDGSQHSEMVYKHSDDLRDAELEKEEFTVLRFWNNEIDQNLEGVMMRVREHLSNVTPSEH
ncbi:MAG: endonuclease domain-containing protein [Robiginitomaculum sp.]|nr:endonuclease domain-containing protein [Robiginitomaculum sp.]